jgi:uncharacterized protein with gpF-like domain
MSENYRVTFDLTDVPALKKNIQEQSEIARMYALMGVPMKQVNEMFKLGVPEYPGWDKSIRVTKPESGEEGERSALMLKKSETRNIEQEIKKKENVAKKEAKGFAEALQAQQAIVFDAIENQEDIVLAVDGSSKGLEEHLTSLYINTAKIFAGSVLVDSRGMDVDFETREISFELEQEIQVFIAEESIILNELALINKVTVEAIITAIIDAEQEGKTITDMQQAIIDLGTFSPERALRIARTTVGTAQSIGQMAGAISVGATKKIWRDSNFEVRKQHQARDGETVDIEARFSRQFPDGLAPRWPLDQEAAASDRINCRCAMTFEI